MYIYYIIYTYIYIYIFIYYIHIRICLSVMHDGWHGSLLRRPLCAILIETEIQAS